MTEPARVGPAASAPAPSASGESLGAAAAAGTPTEVRNRFDGRWAPGFRIEEIEDHQGEVVVRVRRLSDGYLVPAWLPAEDVRTSPNS